MKAQTTIVPLVSAIILAVWSCSLQAQEVLQNVHASVTLSVGVKYADRQPDIEFEVTQPNGNRSTATARARGDGERSGTVSYPDDFTNAGMHQGTYKWRATATGKVLTSGVFKYLPSKTGTQTYVET